MATHNDARGAFQSHAAYLNAFQRIVASTYGPSKSFLRRHGDVLNGLASAVRAKPTFQKMQVDASIDTESIRRILGNAWATEMMLSLASNFDQDEVVGVANNWAAVQGYYALYHAVQALAVCKGQPRPQSHPATQRIFVDQWVTRNADLPPWSLGASDVSCLNLPGGQTIQSIHQWSACDDDTCWSIAYQAMRGTRQDQVSERFREERAKKQSANRKAFAAKQAERLAEGRKALPKRDFALPLLTSQEKFSVRRGLRPITLMDYLYRLRIRSNYEDAQMFIEGPEDISESRAVHRNMRLLLSSTMLVYELYVGQLIGRRALRGMVDSWLASAPLDTKTGLDARHAILFP
ncbi:MAG: hypothetical protein WEC75_09690 [Dehalococcoidia bacterium]